MQIIEKTYQWNGKLGLRSRTDLLILHHAAARECSAADIHRWHLERGWCGIGYNFFVRKDGSVYSGRPESAVGAHTEGYNSRSIGICFEGNFNDETMGDAQIKAGQELVAYIRGKYPSIHVGKHKDYDATACPGAKFPFSEITSVVDAKAETVNATVAKSETVEKTTATTESKGECEVNVPVLRKGDKSGYVKTLQILLNAYNGAKLDADGDFGAKTDAAVRAYQTSRGLERDGIVGAKTWGKLLA